MFEKKSEGIVFGQPGWVAGTNANKQLPGLDKPKPTTETFTAPQLVASQGVDSAPATMNSSRRQAQQPIDAKTFDASCQPSTKPPPEQSQPPATTAPSIATTDGDIFTWIGEFVDLEAPDMAPMKSDLQVLHSAIATFEGNISQVAMNMSQILAATHVKSSEFRKLKTELSGTGIGTGTPSAARDAKIKHVESLKKQLLGLHMALKDHKSKIDSLRSAFVDTLLAPLQTFARVNKSSWEAQLEEKNNYISELRVKLLNLEQKLATAMSDLTKIRAWSEELTTKLEFAESRSAMQNNEHRKKMDNKIAEKDTEMYNALYAQKLKYKAQVEHAEATELQNRKAMTKIDEMESTIRALEREKIGLNMAKGAVEKELGDLEIQVDQWKSYKDAYDQIKHQFDSLQVSFNDAVTERDELVEKVQALETKEQGKSRDEHGLATTEVASTVPRQINHAPTTNADRLDGLADHWKNRLKLTMDSVEKKRTDIAWHDSEIAKIQRHFEPPPVLPQPTQDSRSRPPSTVDTAQVQPLDVGEIPMNDEDHFLNPEASAFQPNSGYDGLAAVSGRSGRVPVQTWASRATGLAPSTRRPSPLQARNTGHQASDQPGLGRETATYGPLNPEYEWQEVSRNRRERDESLRRS
ncbi:uncharacterized protein K460DRAFT_363081 [Cucurbitaria berberidis CBS 394.84]|uniref:Uncharacterized protein n=1 Tax=Cucurbitaria berberidis CBS 394.84 TaxID=1168544 RepID=A0A9P4GJW2_9PLEO|nr:uncharacterized protein K460DRAFT_363081 [Cucurbitaria berberidis CBS 394.84]KAF1846962.1 hypothetical protein K460DRAFT_363081 [Cucurbitaria berberidis CBS 394.84]